MKIEGIKETIEAFEELKVSTEKRIVRKALKAGCEKILPVAIAETPSQSGVMRNAFQIQNGRTKKGTMKMRVGWSKKGHPESYYASFVLYGHYVGSRRLGSKRKYVQPNNSIDRAYEKTIQDALDTVIETLVTGIEKATRRVNKAKG